MTDSLQCLRARQRLDCPYYVQTAPTNRLIDFGDLEDEFGNMRSDWHSHLQSKLATIENLERKGLKKSRMSY
eukprot:scaffold19773_cov43-Cyclotella_meneghiniana.AAC.5